MTSSTTIRCLSCRQPCPANRTGRCTSCRLTINRQRDANPRRRARKKALYTAEHRAERAAWAPLVAAGDVVCDLCSTTILGAFDLGHANGEPSRPQHPRCNRAQQ